MLAGNLIYRASDDVEGVQSRVDQQTEQEPEPVALVMAESEGDEVKRPRFRRITGRLAGRFRLSISRPNRGHVR